VTDTPAQVVTYGLNAGEWRADQLEESGSLLTFRVLHDEHKHGLSTRLAGRHNVLNCLAALAAAAALLLLYLLVTRRGRTLSAIRAAFRPFVPAGVLLGLAYVALLEALTRGRVTIVTPLYATESFWTVLFAAVFLGRSERIGPRLLFSAALMVGGAALIGAFR